MGPSVKAIFVLGRHRSGTTWITNVIASHPEVFTPSHPAHHGQHESAFFSAIAPYFNWGKSEEDRIALRLVFERSDFYQLSVNGIDDRDLSSIRSVFEYFRAFMDQAARSRGCNAWVENTPNHTLYLRELIDNYPDAKFVAIHRDSFEAIRSGVYHLDGESSLWMWVKVSIWTAVYESVLSRYDDELYVIEYWQLTQRFQNVCRDLIDYLGLKYEKIGNDYQKNTSFDDRERTKHPVMRPLSIGIVAAINIVPPIVIEKLSRTYLKIREDRLPEWLFKVFKGGLRDDMSSITES